MCWLFIQGASLVRLARYNDTIGFLTSLFKRGLRWVPQNRYLAIALLSCLLAFFATNYLFANHIPIPVGVYIAVLGLAAAAVTLRKEPNPIEKAVWIVLLTILMVAEIRNLYIAENEQAVKFKETSDALKETKKGLDLANRNLEATAETLEGTAKGIKELWAETTGGDGYLYLEPLEPSVTEDGTVFVNTIMRIKGKFPLPGVHVTIDDISQGMIFDHSYGTLAAVPMMGMPKLQAVLRFRDSDKSPRIFSVFINTTTASFNQQIRFFKVGAKWMRATDLFRFGKGRIYRWFEPGFPTNTIGNDWGKAHHKHLSQ